MSVKFFCRCGRDTFNPNNHSSCYNCRAFQAEEKITGVAIRLPKTTNNNTLNKFYPPLNEFISLRPPYRHNSLFPVLCYLGFEPPYNTEQGFATSHNRFVTREEAWKIADSAGQILHRGAGFDNGVLFSENLW